MEEEGASNGVRELRQRLIGNAGSRGTCKDVHLLCEDIKLFSCNLLKKTVVIEPLFSILVLNQTSRLLL